jgi:hypothetical protein
MSRRKQSPIFVKTYDFLLWLLGRTARFPVAGGAMEARL